jgi:hypothetical protein
MRVRQELLRGSILLLGEPAVPLVDGRGNREGGSVQWINEKTVAAAELLGVAANVVGKVDGLLVDDELFEGESRRD